MGLRSIWALDHRTASSVYLTAADLVAAWQDPGVAASAAKADITLEWLLSGRNTLYLCAPLHEQARLSAVFGGLLGDLVAQAYERSGREGRPLRDTLVVLDEAANTPARWLPNVASTCSGIGMLLVTIWQSKAQIDDAYGTLADSVLTNHGSKIIFSGVSDPSTLEYVSKLLGDEEVRQHAVSTDLRHGGRSVNESTTRLRLLSADLLRQVPPGHALLIHQTLPPAHLRARPYYAERRLRALSAPPQDASPDGRGWEYTA